MRISYYTLFPRSKLPQIFLWGELGPQIELRALTRPACSKEHGEVCLKKSLTKEQRVTEGTVRRRGSE